MATDPAVLGLSIELQMNTLLAEKALGSLSNDVLKLSGDIDKKLNAALNSTKTNFDSLTTSSLTIKSNFEAVSTSAQSFADAFDAITAGSNTIKTDFDNISTSAQSFADAISTASLSNDGLSTSFSTIDAAYTKIAGNFTTIEQKTQSLVTNVKSFSDALTAAATGSLALTTINASIAEFITNVGVLKIAATEMFAGFTLFVGEFKKFDKDNFKPYKENIDNINDATKETYTSFDNISKMLAIIKQLSTEINAEANAGAVISAKELVDFGNIVLAINEISGALQAKNALHTAEATMIKDETALVNSLRAEVDRLKDQIEKNSAVSRNLALIWRTIVNEAKKIDDIAANFRESNNRSVGSMYELASISAKVSVNTGIAAAETAKMVKELISVRTGKEDLVALATTMVKIEKMTGLSGKALASASRTMKNMGYTALETEKTMLGFADSMAKLGIEGGDVQVMLDLMQERTLLFGKTTSALTDKLNKTTAAQLAMAKSLGVSSDEVKKMNSNSMDDIILLEALSGVSIDSAEDMQTAQLAMAASISEEFKDVEGNYRDTIQLQARLKSQGFTDGQIAMYKNMGNEMKRLGIDPDAVDAQEQFAKAMKIANAAGDNFNESMASLSDQLGRLMTTGASLMMMFIMPFMRALTYMVLAVNSVIGIFIYLGDQIAKLSNYIGELFPPWNVFIMILGYVVEVIMIRAAGALILAGTLLALIGPIVSLSIWLYQAATASGFFASAVSAAYSKIMTAINQMVSSLSSILSTIANAVGQAFNTLMGQISSGLDKLASVARTAAVPVLILSIALLITAGALWVMAQALVVVASVDYGKIVAGGLFFAVMLGILGAVLYFVLPALTMGAPVLLAFAVVVLAFGVAALIAAVGIYIMAAAFVLVASVLTPTLALSVALLAVSLYLLAMAMVVFIPAAIPFGVAIILLSYAFFIFSVACVVLAAATILLAYGLSMIAAAMQPGLAAQMQKFGVGLAAFAWEVGFTGALRLAAIGLALLPLALGVMIIGAAFALGGANMGENFKMLAAGISSLSTIDAKAISILSLLAGPLVMFSMGVAAISQALSGAGADFAANFTSVATGISALLKAMSTIDPASIDLLSTISVPLQEFGAGVAGLVTLMAGIDPAALVVFAATATTIAAGVNALASIDTAKIVALGDIAAPLDAFSQAIQSLSDTFMSLDLTFLDTAKAAVIGLKEVAEILATASQPLVVGAFGLLIGAMILNFAVTVVTAGIEALSAAATALASISPILLQASGEILSSGINLWYGASALLRGAYILLGTAPILIFASALIAASTGVLLAASFVLVIFSTALMYAGTAALIGATALLAASTMLFGSAILLLVTGPLLLAAILQLWITVPIITWIAYGMLAAGAILFSGAMSIYFASMFLGVAVNKIADYAQTLNDFADPLERLAASFGGLAASMMLIKDAVSGLSSLPLEAIIESFQKFSPTDEALEKVKSLSLALEKIGIEYSKAITDESRIASELTSGKPTTLTNPAVENEEDPAVKTNQLLDESKDTLSKILEALKPKDQRNSTNFGLSLFGSPRGFEI